MRQALSKIKVPWVCLWHSPTCLLGTPFLLLERILPLLVPPTPHHHPFSFAGADAFASRFLGSNLTPALPPPSGVTSGKTPNWPKPKLWHLEHGVSKLYFIGLL